MLEVKLQKKNQQIIVGFLMKIQCFDLGNIKR